LTSGVRIAPPVVASALTGPHRKSCYFFPSIVCEGTNFDQGILSLKSIGLPRARRCRLVRADAFDAMAAGLND
jgi:hypothetical protein